jgi:hypothetical protein
MRARPAGYTVAVGDEGLGGDEARRHEQLGACALRAALVCRQGGAALAAILQSFGRLSHVLKARVAARRTPAAAGTAALSGHCGSPSLP